MYLILFLLFIKGIRCDWVSEWLAPVEYQYKDFSTQNISDILKPEKDYSMLLPKIEENFPPAQVSSNALSPRTLKIKLEEILKKAKILTTTLKRQIANIENRERKLKEKIANGRSGVTVLTVSTLIGAPHTYFIRDGFWTLCNGIVQYPQAYNMFTELFASPRCIGQEVPSRRDPCVFNSVIKYQTVPTSRRSTYIEDEYLCLRTSFNNTLETFLSVPKRVVDETCTNGTVRSLSENILACGIRVLIEYTYYFNKDGINDMPAEYCNDKDGSCKLMVGWHLSNNTIENFEFFKNDPNFKKFFIRTDQYIEPFM